MRFIELPIKISVYDEEELEKFDSLGIPYSDDSARDAYMRVNPLAIAAYVEIEPGLLDIELVSSTRLTVNITKEQLEDLLYDQ